MSVTITVSQIRAAMAAQAGAGSISGDGAPSNALLGRWFHEILARLIEGNEPANLWSVLADAEPDLDSWKRALVARAYEMDVGPRLTSHRSSLHECAEQVVSFWLAVQAACAWLAEMAWTVAQAEGFVKTTATGEKHLARVSSWHTVKSLFEMEHRLDREFREPGWTDSVKLTGVTDCLLRLPRTGRWCAIEFKLGRTSPEIDLAQACLYHLMLSSHEETVGWDQRRFAAPAHHDSATVGDGGPLLEASWSHPTLNKANTLSGGVASRDDGTLALIRFLPERHETLFSASQLADAQRELVALIGRVAGVDMPQQVSSQPSVRSEKATDAHRELGRKLIAAFAEYGVDVKLTGEPIAGPTFLRFPVEPGRATKVTAIERRASELQIRLGLEAAPFIKIESGHLVVDVERPDRAKVLFADVRSQLPKPHPRLGSAQVPVGVDIEGRLHFADFAKTDHAHLLVAGITGSGKSEWLRLAIAGLMLTNTPEQLRFLIIDPKRNAFHALRDSPYLWRPIVFPDETPAGQVLRELGDEMDRRYTLFDGADSIAQVATRTDIPLPRIVCVCDEYFDLINRNRAERVAVEQQVCRLGAKARAAGIHLILATQQPSRQTIKGALDSNIPARVGLKMQKPLESQMLLNESGAERLLGHGDLLFRAAGPLQRLQAPYIPEEERDAIFGRRR